MRLSPRAQEVPTRVCRAMVSSATLTIVVSSMTRSRRAARQPSVGVAAGSCQIPPACEAPSALGSTRMKVAVSPDRLFEEAVALWHERGLTRPWNDPNVDLLRAMKGSSSTLLAARDDEDALLGAAMVGHDGHRGWVYYLAVRPSEQRQGIGRTFMQACEEWI